MNLNLTTSFLPAVKLVVCTLVGFVAASGGANTPAPPAVTVNNNTITPPACQNNEVRLTADGPCVENFSAMCRDASQAAMEARSSTANACAEAGLGSSVSQCLDQLGRCVGESSRQAGTETNQLSQVLSTVAPSLGLPVTNLPGLTRQNVRTCPSQNARDYFEDRDRINRDIRQTQDDISRVQEDIATEREQLDRQVQEAQERITEGQRALREAQRSLNATRRERMGEHQRNQMTAAEQLRTLSNRILQKRQEMAQYDERYMAELSTYTDELARLTCMGEVQKKRNELNDMLGGGSGSGGGFLQAATDRRRALESLWETCISTVRQQRVAKINERRRWMEAATREISQMEEQIGESDNAISTYNQQMQESLREIDQQVTEEQQDLFQRIQNSQQALSAAQQTTMQKQQALASRQQAAQLRLANLQQDLQNLGPAPERGVTRTWRSAGASYDTYLTAAATYRSNGCCRTPPTGFTHQQNRTLCDLDVDRARRTLPSDGGRGSRPGGVR